jgi:hypothetical protein
MEMAGMQQQQPMHDRSEHPIGCIRRGLNTAGWNDPSAGSSGVFATLEGLFDGIPSETCPRRKSTETTEMRGRNEEGASVITSTSFQTQHVGEAQR